VIHVAAPPTRGTDVFVADEDEVAEVNEADQLLPGMFEPVREHLTRTLRRLTSSERPPTLRQVLGPCSVMG
jgi:hypothetical protein